MYSFDVFDTLITRKTASPIGVFLLMQEYLTEKKIQIYSTYVSNDFANLRIKAEKNASKFLKKNAINLQDIYSVLMQMSDISDEESEELMAAEIELEIKCAVGIEKNIDILLQLYQKKEKIILISDMYLSADVIRNILKKIHPVLGTIPLYVSSDYNATKHDGALYFKVKELENVEYAEWTHYGDNYISDIKIPKFLGINTVYIESRRVPLWEREMTEKIDLNTNLSLQIVLGVTKLARMKQVLSEKEEIGVSVGGVILFPYVEWIINRSMRLGLERLYFIARDGYLLKRIADAYINLYQLRLQTKYIYGSRQAWRVEDEKKRENVRRYLLQEMDYSDNRYALVDLQGTGLSMGYLTGILDEHMPGKLNVFYYDMIDQFENGQCNFMVYSTSGLCEIIEVLCRAPHGATIEYVKRDGRYVPLLENIDECRWRECGLNDYIHGAEVFTEEITQFFVDFNCRIKINFISEFLLKYCYQNPDYAISEFIGELPQDNYNLNDSQKYAPKLNRKNIFQIFMWRTSEKITEYYNGSNLRYSLLRMGSKEMQMIRFYEKNYHRFLGKVIHMFKNRIVRRHDIKFNKKVLVYAAGKFGKSAYDILRTTPGFKVIGWADINYERYQKLGYAVIEPEEIFKLDYDILLVAIKDRVQSDLVKRLLIEAGVNEGYVMQAEEFYLKYKISI